MPFSCTVWAYYWLERIEDLEIRIYYREKCDGSGRKFVRIFAAELAKAAVGQTASPSLTSPSPKS